MFFLYYNWKISAKHGPNNICFFMVSVVNSKNSIISLYHVNCIIAVFGRHKLVVILLLYSIVVEVGGSIPSLSVIYIFYPSTYIVQNNNIPNINIYKNNWFKLMFFKKLYFKLN